MGNDVAIRWPLSSAPGARPQESAGRLINAYAEPLQPESGPAQVVWRRTPGLTRFGDTGLTGWRGGVLTNSTVFAALNEKLVTVDLAGLVAVVGTLSGELPVTAAHNNVQPIPDTGFVTENGAFLVTSGSIVAWPDVDLPQPNSISFQDGFFFFTIGDKRVFASDINSTGINSQTFTTLQSRSDGTLLRGIPYNSLMYFFCGNHIEVFQNTAGSVEAPVFPYTRLTTIDKGLLTAHAISGWENGFGKLMWVADDFGVYRFSGNGLVIEKISPPDLDRLIKAVADTRTLRTSCHVHAGHLVWSISGPTFSWDFNCNTDKWNERASTSNGLIGSAWRGVGSSLLAFGKWLMGSTISGDVVYVDDASFFEEGDNIIWRMESGPVSDFPRSSRVGRADFNFVTGVGLPSGTDTQQDPKVAISWSDDGGITWGNPLIRRLGAGQRGDVRVTILNPGRTKAVGRRWRIDVVDGVYVGFLGATMNVSPRGA